MLKFKFQDFTYFQNFILLKTIIWNYIFFYIISVSIAENNFLLTELYSAI